jgi:hypothetical protein
MQVYACGNGLQHAFGSVLQWRSSSTGEHASTHGDRNEDKDEDAEFWDQLDVSHYLGHTAPPATAAPQGSDTVPGKQSLQQRLPASSPSALNSTGGGARSLVGGGEPSALVKHGAAGNHHLQATTHESPPPPLLRSTFLASARAVQLNAGSPIDVRDLRASSTAAPSSGVHELACMLSVPEPLVMAYVVKR